MDDHRVSRVHELCTCPGHVRLNSMLIDCEVNCEDAFPFQFYFVCRLCPEKLKSENTGNSHEVNIFALFVSCACVALQK